MRLRPDQARTIVVAAQDLADPDARVRHFGSRLDDLARGGDIDLLVECPRRVARPVWLATQITAQLGLRGFRLNLSIESAANLKELIELLPKIQAAAGADHCKELEAALRG